MAFKQRVFRAIFFSGFAFFSVAINGCDALYLRDSARLERVQQREPIVVLTTAGSLTYNKKQTEASGIDHDLLEDFAHQYNLKLKYKVYKTESEVLSALRAGEGDVAAARLRPPQRQNAFLTGPAYEETHLSLFCRSRLQIAHVSDLNGLKVAIQSKDNYADFDRRLQRLAPRADIVFVQDQRSVQLLKSVEDKKFDCAIAEDVTGRLALRLTPSLEHVADLSEKYSLNWLLTSNNQDLKILMQAWFQTASRNDEIMRVMDRYQIYANQLDRNDLRRFRRNLFETLPQYRQTFSEAGKTYNLPWQLIAAVAYQESHWNPDAKSFTGVRGIMQLTNETALRFGIEDRLDPIQSIDGGSKYLRLLLDKTPHYLHHKDRVALALAAYNIGSAHLRDAQKLAEKMGRNPYSWRHLREVLPLLAEPRYASQLEYGAARGYETVAFVERVKSFYNYMLAVN